MIAVSFASISHRKQQDAWRKGCESAGMSCLTFDQSILSEQDMKGYYGDRGYGYWFWKPIVIKKALAVYGEVLYTDVDYTVLHQEPLLKMLNSSAHGLVMFNYPFQNHIWTKRDCFFYMDCDRPEYWDGLHLEAGISIWRKSAFTDNLLSELSACCNDRRILSDDPNTCGLPNLPGFRDHRHDQSILSLLKEKYKIPTVPIAELRGIISGADI